MTFQELLASLTLGELLMMIKELRQHPDDRHHLNLALQELGRRDEAR